MTVGNYYRFDNKGTAFYYCNCEPWLSLSGVRQPCPGPFQSLSLALYGFSTFSKSTFGPQGPLARISRCKVPRDLSRYSPVVGGPPAQIISLDLIGPHRDLLGWTLGYGARAELGGMKLQWGFKSPGVCLSGRFTPFSFQIVLYTVFRQLFLESG